jgi:hypothetical protein
VHTPQPEKKDNIMKVNQNTESPNLRLTQVPKYRTTEPPKHIRSGLRPLTPGSVVRSPVVRGPELYSLQRGLGFWDLTFNGQRTTLKHEQGLAYVSYLLMNPGCEPIHALDLATRVAAANGKATGIIEIVDPETGHTAYLEDHARIQERSPALDKAAEMRAVLRQQNKLEALLEQEDQIEPIREEALRDLVVLYRYESKQSKRVRDSAQKAVHAVRTAIKRLNTKLASARNADGTPNSLLRAFAAHIEQFILLPSTPRAGRFSSQPGPGSPGCFTYEPPAGVHWTT